MDYTDSFSIKNRELLPENILYKHPKISIEYHRPAMMMISEEYMNVFRIPSKICLELSSRANKAQLACEILHNSNFV